MRKKSRKNLIKKKESKMRKQTFLEKIKELIGGFGWWLFIKFNYDGDQEKYFERLKVEFEFDELNKNKK